MTRDCACKPSISSGLVWEKFPHGRVVSTLLKYMLVVKVSFIFLDGQTMSDKSQRPAQKRKTQGLDRFGGTYN